MHDRVFRTLDGIRGVAALLIVMRHTENFFAPTTFQESYLAVDLFFVMSGAVLCQSYENRLLHTMSPWRFAWLRIVRIYPLYLLGCAIAIPALLLTPDSLIDLRILPRVVLLAAFLLPNVFGRDLYPLDAPSWSLFFELFVNIVYGFLVHRLTSRVVVVLVVLSGIALVPVIVFSKHHNLNLGFTLKSFPTGFVRVAYSFFVGVLACRIYHRRPVLVGGLAGNAWSWVVLAFVTILLILPVDVRLQGRYDFCVVAFVFPAIVAASLTLVMSGTSARIFRALGVVSYAVYVLHAPLARLVESGLPHQGLEIVPFAPWAGIAFLVVLVIGCYGIDQIYDTPLRRRLARIGASKAGGAASRA